METTTDRKFNERDLLELGDLYLKNGVSIKRVSHAKFKTVLANAQEKKPETLEEFGRINRESQLLNIIIVIKENGRA